MSRIRFVGFLLTAIILGAVPLWSQTYPFEYKTWIDTDNDPGTGCLVDVGGDQFDGAELVVTMVVDPASLSATAVQEQTCQGGTWSAPVVIDGGNWPVGIDVGVNGSDVVEGYVPITAPRIRLGFSAGANLSSDTLFTDEGGGAIALLLLGQIPVNSGPGLLVFIVLMAVAGLMALRRGYGAVAVALLCTSVTVAGVRVVLACQADGNVGEWAGSQPIATDPAGDANPDDPAADLVAAFVTYDPGELCLRLDIADVENQGLVVEKATNGHDADTAPGPTVTEGQVVTWTYVVTNTGQTQLSNVSVSDDHVGAVGCPTSSLPPGGSMTCVATGVAIAGQYTNLATVAALEPSGSTLTDSDPSHYLGEALVSEIRIEKATNGHDADTAPGPSIPLGAAVTWNYLVTNTGQTQLSNLSVSDDHVGAVSCPTSSLPPGGSMTCVATGVAIAGQYDNLGIASGQSPSGQTVSDSDPSHYLGVAPALSINDVTVSEDGGSAVFTVAMSIPSGQPVTVDYFTSDGTATAGADYSAVSGTITFSPSEVTRTLSVPVLEDLVFEGPETFTVDLSNPSNATILDGQGVATVIDNDALPSLAGKIVINEIGMSSDLPGRSFVEFLSLVVNASDTTPRDMQQVSLFIVGQDGQVVRINQGFISTTIPANGTMIVYKDGVLEIRNKAGNVKNIDAADANWADDAEVYLGGAWVDYDPSIHDFAFGNTTADPLLVNFQQSGISIDYFVANGPTPATSPAEVMNGIWYPPVGAPAPEGEFTSFDGSLTDEAGFARVFITPGDQPFVVEPGEIDSDRAADWTTNSTPTLFLGGLNPTQVAGANPDDDDGQTILFGTDNREVLEGLEGPDFLFGRGGDDTVAGGEGDDLLGGGTGDDVVFGDEGDDRVVDTDADFDTPGGASDVDGGLGIDTFQFAAGSDAASLQLTNATEVAARLTGIEFLDMGDGDGLDELTLTAEAAIALGDSNQAGTIAPPVPGGIVDIFVTGDASGAVDTVNLQGPGWVLDIGPPVTIGTDTFDIWTESSGGGEAVVAIRQGLAVNPDVP